MRLLRFGAAGGGHDDPHDYSAANVRAGVEQSLRLLRTDYLVQVHLSPSRAEMEAGGTVEALQSLQAEGKVRFIGMSGTLPNLPDHVAVGVFDVFQIPYSALQPEHGDLVSRAAQAGAGVLIRGGVARGTASPDKNWTVQPLSSSGPAAQDRWEAAKRGNVAMASRGPLPDDLYAEAARRLAAA